MYDRIAVPLDGSATAFRAIGPARRVARAHDAGLELVTVATDRRTAEAVLTEGRRLAGSDDVDTVVLEHADAAVALGDHDASDPRTLLCMTTRGRGSAHRALVGSTALAVVEHSPHAVVLIGPRCDLDRDSPISPVIVCLDGTPEAEHVVGWATAWCAHTGASITLLRVVYPIGEPGAGDPPGTATIHDLRYLERVAERVRADHPDVTHLTLPHERPTDAIRHASRGHDDAMLAVTTSHPGRTTQLLLGSRAADVIRAATVPVLVASKHGTAPPP